MAPYAPKYIIIKNYIIEEIRNGNLKMGDQIPSENDLSKLFNVSRITANAAIKELAMEGIVERIQGKGSFVKEYRGIDTELYHETPKSIKISSESMESNFHVLKKVSLIYPDQIICTKLNIPVTEKVYEIVRFMSRQDEVIAIDYSYIPYFLLQEKGKIDFEQLNSMYLHEFVLNVLKIEVKHIHIHIDAKLPNEFEAKTIAVPDDYPLVIWDTGVLNKNSILIAYTTTIADPKKYRAFINFEI
jgi:DNA-binding GntR family transcriptional regulator